MWRRLRWLSRALKDKLMRKTLAAVMSLCVLSAWTGCGSEPPAPAPETAQKPSEPSVPPEIQAAASALLGAEAEVLVFGDLAKTGQTQALVINRLKKAPANVAPGILLTRGAILGRGRREVDRALSRG